LEEKKTYWQKQYNNTGTKAHETKEEENMNTADKNIVFNTKKGKKVDLDAPLLPGR